MNKNHVYKNRLLKLADFLDNLLDEQFSFDRWVGNDWDQKANLSCGTSACALGWATTIPLFRKLGLRLVANPTYEGKSGFKFVIALKDTVNPNNTSYRDACEKIFGVDKSEANFLFTPGSMLGSSNNYLDDNASPAEVSDNIRRFIRLKSW